MDARLEHALRRRLGARVLFEEPLAKHTSLRVGGPADALARVQSREELAEVLVLCREHGSPVRVLGAGFNTLVRDGGLREVVVRLAGLRGAQALEGGRVFLEAGLTHASATRFCAERGLAGLEFAVGIPGTVGGWLAMNAGIGSREMRNVVERVDTMEAASGAVAALEGPALRFRYRSLEAPPGAVLLGAQLALEPDDPGAIRARMRELLASRRETQPVDEPSCGSVFKNPPGQSAWRLVDAAGLRGRSVGGARISERHTNFIVTRPGARARDVLELIECARETVARELKVELELEVQVMGEEAL